MHVVVETLFLYLKICLSRCFVTSFVLLPIVHRMNVFQALREMVCSRFMVSPVVQSCPCVHRNTIILEMKVNGRF